MATKPLGRAPLQIAFRPSKIRADAQARGALMAMAAKVQDEAHWQSILAKAETDAQREELERVIGPLLAFRRPDTACTTPECDSGEPGVWQPVLVVANPVDPTDTSWVPIELRLCDTCKAEASVEHFVTDDIWRQIIHAWDQPQWPPVRRLTRLTWDRTH